jgi:hypothetical protein
MTRRKTPRIIHLPESVGGNAFELSNAMRQLGLESQCWILKPNYLNFGHDYSITQIDDGYLLTELKRFLALRYIFQFDVVFFNFGSTLFRPIALSHRPEWSKTFYVAARFYMVYAKAMQKIELWLLRLLNRKIIIQYQGDDARQGDYCLRTYAISPATQVNEHYYHPASDRQKRSQIQLLARHCQAIYALNPDILNVLPHKAKFLPYTHIMLEDWPVCYSDPSSKLPLRIAHAPTHRQIKGTSHFIAALERLRKAGFEFELVLIENLSREEAKSIYKTVDVVLDQLFVGWYGGLAVEAMALGKPVVCYIRDEDLVHIPRDMKDALPVIRASISTLDEDLRKLLSSTRETLVDIGKRSRSYVEQWHDPKTVVKMFLPELLVR